MGLYRGKGPTRTVINKSDRAIRGEVCNVAAGDPFEATKGWCRRHKGLFTRNVLAFADEQDDGAEIGEQVGAVGPEEGFEPDLRVESLGDESVGDEDELVSIDDESDAPIDDETHEPDLDDEDELVSFEVSLQSMTVPNLKLLCKENNLKVGGKKAELIARLTEAGNHGAN